MRAYKVRGDFEDLSRALMMFTSSNSLFKTSFFPHSSSLSFMLLGTPRVICVDVWKQDRKTCVCMVFKLGAKASWP